MRARSVAREPRAAPSLGARRAPAVEPFATHENPGVRAAAVEALGRLASFPTMPSVANALVDPQPDVRRAAAVAAEDASPDA